jgi:molecular chaperone DnaK (HSP70)
MSMAMSSGNPAPMDPGFRLGIDFGTWNTTAVLRWPDGHTRPLLFDGSPLLPSAVYVEPDGHLLVGRDAIHAARLDPARLEPNPKRRMERDGQDTTVRLGDQEVTVAAMVSAVLARIAEEAVRVSGVPVSGMAVTLTHPAAWDAARLALLQRAGAGAGLPEPRLLPEPVAAAGYFVSVLGRTIPAGSALVVYDFGAGTFDASVVVPDGTDQATGGYRVLALAGLVDVGGVDLDAALLRHVAASHRDTDPDAWDRLGAPATPADRRHRRHLVEDVRAAKEMLSRATTATVPVPLLELEVRVTRAEFDALARPLLERTVSTTVTAIAAAGVSPERIAAVLLVGGSSRIPLVAELLRAGTGQTPSTIDQPETVVAEGSIRLATGGSGLTRPSSPVAFVPTSPGPANATTEAGFAANPNATTAAGVASNPNATTVAGGQAAPTVPMGPPRAGVPVDPWAGAARSAPPAPMPSAPMPMPAPPAPVQPTRIAATQVAAFAPASAPVGRPPNPPPHPGPGRMAPAGSGPGGIAPGRERYRRPAAPGYPAATGRKGSGRGPILLTAVLAVLVLAAGAAFLLRDQLFTTQAGPLVPSTAPTTTTSSPPAGPYTRTETPAWLPAGWSSVVDDKATASVIAGPANNGGNCDYTAPGVLHVTRDAYDVSGCQTAQAVKDLVVSDAAVEAQFSVTAGCAGMWMRTGSSGYFVMVCADGTVGLHKLVDDPPSSATVLGPIWRGTDPKNMVVGLLARGLDPVTLTVYVDGTAQQPVVDATTATGAPLRTGHLALGGYAPHPDDRMDATITRYRAWTPVGA